MNLRHLPLLAALLAASFGVLAQEAAPSASLAVTPIVVNGVTVPPVYADFVRQSRINRGQSPEAISNESIREALINTEILAQEATKKGLDKASTLQSALAFHRMDLLSQAAIQDFMKANPIPESVVRSEYEKLKASAGAREFRARHILLDDEKKARELLITLKVNKKVTFAELAKKYSKDPSATNGGDLGWNIPGNYVREFAAAMSNLGKGEVSTDPVKTNFGWHIIKVDDVRNFNFPTFDKLKERIAQQIQQNNVRAWLQKLRAASRIE